MPDSPHTTALPSRTRRAFLRGTAGALAASAAVAVPAIAAPGGPDAELVQLGREFDALAVAHAAARDAFDAAEERWSKTPLPEPEALIKTARDVELRLCWPYSVGERYSARAIADFRENPVRKVRVSRPIVPEDGFPADAEALVYSEPCAEATARAAEIVAADDAYIAAKRQQHEEICGASSNALSASYHRMDEVAEAIRAMPVHTLAGVAVKARAARWEMAEWWEEDERELDWSERMVRHFIDEMVALGSATES